ncbi:30S ribosomal protein S20 [Deferribacterales bacterium RsTz2092]|nr:30S ribosomal protein S20 [Deferribacterales bacterium]
MAHTLSALKRIRQSEKRRLRNRSEKSKVRTAVKKYSAALADGVAEKASEALTGGVSALYRAVTKGLLHKNNAARKVSRMVKKLNALKNA